MEISESVTHTSRYPHYSPPLDFPSLVHVDMFNLHLIEASMHRFMMNELTGNYAEEREGEKERFGGEGKETYRVSITNQCTQLCINTAIPQTKEVRHLPSNTYLQFELKATQAEQKAQTHHKQLSCSPNYFH